jgi:hypothetical protein
MDLPKITDLPKIGDKLAIPFFCWLIYYFYRKPELNTEEKILFLFVIGGFIADLFFVFYVYQIIN